MYAFEFKKAKTVEDALKAVAGDDDAKFLGGGQTLLPTMKQRLASPTKLVSLAGVEEMVGISQDGTTLVIGGATPHARVAREVADIFPALSYLAGHIGDPAVRNRGTIGGSLANNDPSACYPSAVMATGATIVTDRREIPAADYFEGLFTTALEDHEIITSVRFPIPQAANYQKFIQPASRFSLVGVFVARYADRVGVAITGASENGVLRWEESEQALARNFSADAVRSLSVSPDEMIEDLYGSKAYRAHLIPVLTARAVAAAA